MQLILFLWDFIRHPQYDTYALLFYFCIGLLLGTLWHLLERRRR